MNKQDAMTIRSARKQDWPQIRVLLQSNALPLDGADVHIADFLVAEKDGAICGCAGLEYHGAFALLRSCAVDHHNRGHGVGRELVRRTISSAQARSIIQIVLLTNTAEQYFLQFGFQTITRADVPEELRATEQFHTSCPITATVMRLIT